MADQLEEKYGLKPVTVARMLGYSSRTTVYALVKRGLLRPIDGCPSMRFSPAEVEAFAARTRDAQGSAA